ncbi:Uncharacterised protein [uncultured archaeon]|nr:Uncharacterised protein [uncultured archaeon]
MAAKSLLKVFKEHYWPSVRRVDVYLPILVAIILGALLHVFYSRLASLSGDYVVFVIDFITALAVVGLTNFYQGHRKERAGFIMLFLGLFAIISIFRALSTSSGETAALSLNLISATLAAMLGFFFYSLEEMRKSRVAKSAKSDRK